LPFSDDGAKLTLDKIRLPKGKVHTYDFSVDPRVGKETKIVTPKVTAVHRASEDCFFIKVWAEKAVEVRAVLIFSPFAESNQTQDFAQRVGVEVAQRSLEDEYMGAP
jgi:hypothetical protein